MAADPLDGDVRRLRFSGRGGSNGDPIGYSPVRSEDMTDPAFTLTPLDIRKQEFRKSLRGYDTAGVEDFQMRVADVLERANRERQVLTVGAFQHVGDAHLEIFDARRIIAAQALAELLLTDVERRQGERGIRHVLGPNRTVPNRITVAPSATAEA